MDLNLYCLLFTYGFVAAKHLMGLKKHITIKDFDKAKAIQGITNELGLLLFLFLIYLMPKYIDISLMGLDLNEIVTVVLVYPLVNSIVEAYNKAMELRNIDISEIDKG